MCYLNGWKDYRYIVYVLISNLIVNEYINILNNVFTQILYMYNQIDKFISRSSYYADWPYSADPCHGWIHTVLHHPYDVPDKRNAALWLARVSLPKNVQVSSAEHFSITCTGTHVPVVYWLLLFVSSELYWDTCIIRIRKFLEFDWMINFIFKVYKNFGNASNFL